MAKVVLLIEDTSNGEVQVALDSDPPIGDGKNMTWAQAKGIIALNAVLEDADGQWVTRKPDALRDKGNQGQGN